MAQYSRTVLTDAGVILARRIMDDETLTMEFTRIQTGSGEYSSGEDIASRTSLKAPKQSFPISSRSVTSEQVLHLKYVVSNVNPDSSPLTVGYYVRELAIYAQVSGEAEILYAIAIADADSADYLPEYDELQPTTITMDWFLPVGNAEQINVYASPDAYALAEDLEALALVVDEKLDADGDSAGNTVTFTSSDVPDSSVTKDTGWTTSGALSSGETHESFMTKISRMIKNIRWLYKLIGTTDISSIGNGTITGGLSSLNDSLNAIGNIASSTAQTLTVASGRWITFDTLTVIKTGKYIVTGDIDFSTNANGIRILLIDTTEGQNNNATNSVVTEGRGTLSKTRIVTLNAGDKLYLRAYQTSGGTITCSGLIRAIYITE